nr:hypothetical protein [Haemoproteus lanii]
MNIYLYSKLNKTKYKTYRINIKYKKKYNLYKIGIYNSKLNLFSCLYFKLLKYLKQGLTISKNLLKILLYFIKHNKIKL